MKKLSRLAVMLALVLALTACSGGADTPCPDEQTEGQHPVTDAAELEGQWTSPSGNILSFSADQGRYTYQTFSGRTEQGPYDAAADVPTIDFDGFLYDFILRDDGVLLPNQNGSGGVMGASGGKKLQGAAQGGLAQDALRAVFQESEYLPRQHISQETLQASGLPLPQAERMSGSGLVRARYHGLPLEISNLELLDLQPYQDPATQNWENNEVPVFRGRWMAAQLGRTLPCDLQAAPKGKLARLLGRDGFSSEDPEFDKRFSVQCGDPAAAQALLSPQVMDQLLHLGKVYLSVKADGRVFAAIQTDEPLFDAGKGRADQMNERFAGQLRDFTDLLDAMRG